jgi:D-hydroxyproline dehydrogenase subunit beta
MPQSVLIIGAGLIGASLAFHLSRMGAVVTVLEAGQPANAASGRSFGWINASFYASPAHHRLRVQGIAAHHRLHALLPDAPYQWQGALWFEDDAVFDQRQAALSGLGYAHTALTSAQIAAREPGLVQRPRRALLLPDEGAVDAGQLTRALLAASGARVLSGLAAKSLIDKDGQIRGARTPIGPFLADHTILATGIATPGLLAPLGLRLPMLTRPGQLLYTRPVSFRLSHILVAPGQEIRQDASGRLLAPATADHQADTAESIPHAAADVEATLHRLRALFDHPDIVLDRAIIGHRPVPDDGLPVVGQAMPGLSLAVAHSGVTLAAVVGEVLAQEILGQGDHPLLSDFRPARFS